VYSNNIISRKSHEIIRQQATIPILCYHARTDPRDDPIVPTTTESSEDFNGDLDKCFPKYLQNPILKKFYDAGGDPKTGAALTAAAAAAKFYAKHKNAIKVARLGAGATGLGVAVTFALVLAENAIEEDVAQAKQKCLTPRCPRGSKLETWTETIPPYNKRYNR